MFILQFCLLSISQLFADNLQTNHHWYRIIILPQLSDIRKIKVMNRQRINKTRPVYQSIIQRVRKNKKTSLTSPNQIKQILGSHIQNLKAYEDKQIALNAKSILEQQSIKYEDYYNNLDVQYHQKSMDHDKNITGWQQPIRAASQSLLVELKVKKSVKNGIQRYHSQGKQKYPQLKKSTVASLGNSIYVSSIKNKQVYRTKPVSLIKDLETETQNFKLNTIEKNIIYENYLQQLENPLKSKKRLTTLKQRQQKFTESQSQEFMKSLSSKEILSHKKWVKKNIPFSRTSKHSQSLFIINNQKSIEGIDQMSLQKLKQNARNLKKKSLKSQNGQLKKYLYKNQQNFLISPQIIQYETNQLENLRCRQSGKNIRLNHKKYSVKDIVYTMIKNNYRSQKSCDEKQKAISHNYSYLPYRLSVKKDSNQSQKRLSKIIESQQAETKTKPTIIKLQTNSNTSDKCAKQSQQIKKVMNAFDRLNRIQAKFNQKFVQVHRK